MFSSTAADSHVTKGVSLARRKWWGPAVQLFEVTTSKLHTRRRAH